MSTHIHLSVLGQLPRPVLGRYFPFKRGLEGLKYWVKAFYLSSWIKCESISARQDLCPELILASSHLCVISVDESYLNLDPTIHPQIYEDYTDENVDSPGL